MKYNSFFRHRSSLQERQEFIKEQATKSIVSSFRHWELTKKLERSINYQKNILKKRCWELKCCLARQWNVCHIAEHCCLLAHWGVGQAIFMVMDTLRLVSPNLPASSHGHNMVKLLTFAENYFYLQCVNSNIKSSSRGTWGYLSTFHVSHLWLYFVSHHLD